MPITKPDMEFIWASGGAIVEPSDTKKQTGWTAEVPPHQWENWIQNRQDQYLAHVNERGIPEWDGNTEYLASGLSYVQGSDGIVYKSVAASGPSTTIQDPTTDVSDTYWTVAFADVGAFLTEATADTLYLRQDENGADIPDAPTFRTNIGVYSKTETDSRDTTRVTRISSATLQTVSGATVTPAVYTPLSYNFVADGGMYDIHVKMNLNLITTGAGASNYVAVKLLDGVTVLDTSAINILIEQQYGQQLTLKWSGILSGAVNLTVTFEKTYAAGSLTVNGDRDNTTNNDSGQLSLIEIYRTGV